MDDGRARPLGDDEDAGGVVQELVRPDLDAVDLRPVGEEEAAAGELGAAAPTAGELVAATPTAGELVAVLRAAVEEDVQRVEVAVLVRAESVARAARGVLPQEDPVEGVGVSTPLARFARSTSPRSRGR